MNDAENSAKNFLQRWSRRKRAAETRAPSGTALPIATRMNDDSNVPTPAQGEAELRKFDPVTLPPIDSITAMSDIRAFLAPGVPEELTRAALRRVWVSDPTIRDFVGMAENQWDFTKPDGVPGFGTLELTPELRSMVASLFGEAPGQIAPQPQAIAEQTRTLEETKRQTPTAGVLAPSKENLGAELSPVRTEPVGSPYAPAKPAQMMLEDSNYDAATHEIPDEAGESPRSGHRAHGGALPK